MRAKYIVGAIAVGLGAGIYAKFIFNPVHATHFPKLAQASVEHKPENGDRKPANTAISTRLKHDMPKNGIDLAVNHGVPANAAVIPGKTASTLFQSPQFDPPPPLAEPEAKSGAKEKNENLFVKPKEGEKIGVADAKAARDLIRSKIGAAQADDFDLKSTKQDSLGNKYYKFSQTYQDIPVFGHEVVVQADTSLNLKSLSGSFKSGIELSLVAQLDGETAVKMALSKSGDPIVGSPKIHDQPQLWVYVDDHEAQILTYRTVVEYTKSRAGYQIDELFVDANSGKVVAMHPKIFSGLSRETRTASNACMNQWNQGTVLPGQVIDPANDNAAKSAYDNMGTAYWFYKQWLSRDSLDGKGAALKSTLHLLFDGGYGNCTGDNAMYTPVYGMLVGNGGTNLHDISGALDIMAHELTHGVTANESALVYKGESGAINEALSDIFGSAAEAWRDSGGTSSTNPSSGLKFNATNWTVGEAATVGGKMVRYMNDPAKDGQSKDNYDSRYLGTQDSGGVHINSGIMNLAFHLLASGGTHPRGATNVSVVGIGAEKALKIYYHAATNLFTSTTDFKAARNLLAQSAETLYGNCSQEVKSVQQSWDAVKAPGTWSCSNTGTSSGGGGSTGGTAPANANLALGAKASASTSYSAAFSPAQLNDGNNSTAWASRTIYTPYAQEWVMLDLGSNKSVKSMIIKWSGASFAKQYGIWVQQNHSWVLLKSGIKTSSGDTTVIINAPSMRYVVLSMSGGNVFGNYMINELALQ